LERENWWKRTFRGRRGRKRGRTINQEGQGWEKTKYGVDGGEQKETEKNEHI